MHKADAIATNRRRSGPHLTAVRAQGCLPLLFRTAHRAGGHARSQRRSPIGIVEGIVAIERYEVVIDGYGQPRRHDADGRSSGCAAGGVAPDAGRPRDRVAASRPAGRDRRPHRGRAERAERDSRAGPADHRAARSLARRRCASLRRRSANARGATIAEATRHDDDDSRSRAAIDPALATAGVQDAIGRAAAAAGLERSACRAAPDTTRSMMAQLGPMGMIFVPSVGGISHSPRELTCWEDCANGANVLLQAVLGADASTDLRG